MKKVFIVYASAGAGHQKAAEAVYDYLQETRQDLELKLINILDYCNPLVKFLYSKGYILLISKHQWLWYLIYRVSALLANNSFRFLTDYISAQRFVKLLKAEKPDIIFSTHFLLSSIITVFKRKAPSSKLRLLTIITDYNLHPYWIGEGVDLYITSCGFVKDELRKRAIPEDKIRVYGIPAHQKFYLALDRNNTAQKLGVDPSKFTILIITGAIGIGPIEEIVKALADIAQLLVVCGRNQGLFMRLNRLSYPHVTPYPLIDFVDELMSVSDIILTKAGGLTISESLAKRLPMIFFSNIPGLETANARVISAYGASFIPRTIPEIKEKTLSLLNDLTLSHQVARNLNALRKVDALSKIASEIPSPASTTS